MTSRSNQFVHNPFFRSRCPYCLERKLDKDALILYYSSCHDYEDDPLSNLYTELNKTLQSNPPRKIIIDLRNNQGGDSSLFRPMLKKLQSFKRKHPKTAFYVLVNESVFSSGIINAYDAKNSLKAKVIGTTPMQKPNHYGYVREIKLPNTKIVVQYSTKYFKFTDNDAEEFSPDHEVSLSVRDYLQGKDSVLEEALK